MRKKFDIGSLPQRPDLSFEISLWDQGIKLVAGIDEAGRGAWAGPVYAAVVIFPPDRSLFTRLSGVDDLKRLKPTEREVCAEQIKNTALAWCIGFAHTQPKLMI